MNISTAQAFIAASVDQLIDIDQDMEELIAEYGKTDWASSKLKLRLLITRCEILRERLQQTDNELTQLLAETNASDERQHSISVSQQLLKQNLFILESKLSTLNQMKDHSVLIQSQQEMNRELERKIAIQRLRDSLRQTQGHKG